MSYRLIFDDPVTEDLADLPKAVRERIVAKLATLADDPRPGSARPLTGELRGEWRLRIGDYRVAYSIDDERRTVHVWNVGHRSRFYERARRRRGR